MVLYLYFLNSSAGLVIASQLVSCAPTDNIMAQALDSHNNYRARHHVLANHAIGLGQTCVFGHVVMEVAVDSWYNKVSNYDYNTYASSNGGEILRFTQVIWKDTTEIGYGATANVIRP
ncbi:hypothetical protein HPULCUR_000222 [Helicostylum pulchrum]|uniref:SCP domain-containing protein n=1 Tax=Helicostylum pulchrum TaxID=562976 RepID=A0ABP9XJ88_9FUNG